MEEIGLFPLDIVLVPGERLPLHIFEDRYRELIAECLENSTEFGLIFRQGVALSGVGTRAEVHDVLRRYPDGRLDIVVVGGNRFRLVEETEGRSFLTARVDDVEDLDDPPSPEELAACMDAFARIVALVGDDVPAPDVAASPSFGIAARLGLPAELRQELLEMLSERDRVLRLTEALDGPVTTQLRARQIEQRAAGNGKVDHL